MTAEELGSGDVVKSLETQNATVMIRAFQLFELYDADGNGCIDKEEYWNVRFIPTLAHNAIPEPLATAAACVTTACVTHGLISHTS